LVAQPSTTYVSPQAYLEWEETQEERHEYHDGVIRAMSGGTYDHSVINSNLVHAITVQLARKNCTTHGGGLKVRIRACNRYFYPDVAVICGSPSFTDGRRDTVDNPVLVVEVLSKSTEHFDRTTKLDCYSKLDSIQVCLLVSQYEPRIEKYTKIAGSNNWERAPYPGIDAVVPLPEIDCELRADEVYERIEFEPAADTEVDAENLER
jgi:Uma2 family endonuclease